jgi:hypothetical protein
MDELDVPGLLIDAHAILVVEPGAHAPRAEIVRSRAEHGDLNEIAALLAGSATPRVGAGARRVLRRG